MYEGNYNKTKVKMFIKLLGNIQGLRILDYGGGAGYMSVLMALMDAEVILVDAEENALKTAEYYASLKGVKNKIKTIKADTITEDLMNEQFDIVIAKDVIEHIHRDLEFVENISRCVKEGGKLILSTQNKFSLNYLIEGTAYKLFRPSRKWMGWDRTHIRFYTPFSLRKILNSNGFTSLSYSGVYIFPYYIINLLTAGKIKIELSFLKHFDLLLGHIFPFNRIGWNIIIRATRRST